MDTPADLLELRLAVPADVGGLVNPFDGSKNETGVRSTAPLELIKEFAPDVLVKAVDHQKNGIVGAPDVMATGGELHLARVPGLSTTKPLLRHIRP